MTEASQRPQRAAPSVSRGSLKIDHKMAPAYLIGQLQLVVLGIPLTPRTSNMLHARLHVVKTLSIGRLRPGVELRRRLAMSQATPPPIKICPGFHDPVRVAKMQYRPLGSTGMVTSILSIGGAGFGNVYGSIDSKESVGVLHTALRWGINYIDTAPWYGQGDSERFLGKALKGVPREAYLIATKVGRYEKDVRRMFDFSPARIKQSAKESLQRLGLEYVDVLQLHDIEYAPDIESSPDVDFVVNVALPALQELKDNGLCRFIGITGYPLDILKEVVERSQVKIDTVLTYCHLSLNDSTLVEDFHFFAERGVPLINASPVSMGLLTHSSPPSWHPAAPEIIEACSKAADYCKQHGVSITKLAMQYSMSFSQVSVAVMGFTHANVLSTVQSSLQILITLSCGLYSLSVCKSANVVWTISTDIWPCYNII